MRRAVIYTRISRDISGEGLGVARQEKDCRELAARRGWEVVAVHSDNDVSAASGKPRPGWQAVLRAIESGEADALVAYSSSRMYRRLADLGVLLELVRERGTSIATVASSDIDLATADGRMLANVMAAIDQGEVERLQERVRRQRRQRVEAGMDAGGSRPFGYEAVPTGPPRVGDGRPRLQLTGEVVPDEAELIREAAQRLLRGESLRSIVRDWDDRNIRTPKGNPWKSAPLRHMLRNPRLVGIHPETGERASWKPILDRRTHQALVELFADPTRLRSRRGNRWLLTGLVFCGLCGGRMTGRPSGESRRYVCDNVGRVHLSVSADRLEPYVVDQAGARSPQYEEPAVADLSAAQGSILGQLDEVEAKLATWAREAATAGLRASDIRAGAAALAADRERLESELEAIQPTPTTWGDFAAEMAMTRPWLEAVIERVTVAPAPSRRGRQFDSSRVSIAFRP